MKNYVKIVANRIEFHDVFAFLNDFDVKRPNNFLKMDFREVFGFLEKLYLFYNAHEFFDVFMCFLTAGLHNYFLHSIRWNPVADMSF